MGGGKKSPKWDWLSALQITSQDVKGYLWGTKKGSVFENIAEHVYNILRCLILL